MSVVHHHLQRIAQCALVREQQADDAEIGELARFGHAQAERLAAGGNGRGFQQAHGRIDGDTLFGGQQLGLAQAHGSQQVVGIEPQVVGHVQVVGQDGRANELGHAKAFPGVVFYGNSQS
ncbi:hypothetical protein D3C80_954730 [compost metagenome]